MWMAATSTQPPPVRGWAVVTVALCARVRRHSRPPAQRAHTHRITRATAARARTSVKHWPLHAARMRASAGSRTASARSARRPPRAPDVRGDVGLGDPQPSSATPDDCARRSCVRTAAPAPATRADATDSSRTVGVGVRAPHRVAARQTMRDLAGADWCFDRRRQTPNPNRIESAARILSFCVAMFARFRFRLCVCAGVCVPRPHTTDRIGDDVGAPTGQARRAAPRVARRVTSVPSRLPRTHSYSALSAIDSCARRGATRATRPATDDSQHAVRARLLCGDDGRTTGTNERTNQAMPALLSRHCAKFKIELSGGRAVGRSGGRAVGRSGAGGRVQT